MKTLIILVTFLTVALCSAFAQDTLTIIHVNDTHSCLSPLGPRTVDLQGTQGGIARAATVIRESKSKETNVLVLHGGDVSIGDPLYNEFYGVAEYQLMKEIGFDAIVPGNHEFDLSPYYLDTAYQNSFSPGDGFSIVCANAKFDDPGVSNLNNYIKPYVIKDFGNVKAGIFGLLTPETNITSQPAPAVIEDDFITSAVNEVAELLSQKCDVIICLSHLGIALDKLLASSVPGINVIISAHDHIATPVPVEIENTLGGKTFIVQADAFYKFAGKMKLIINEPGISVADYKLISLDSSIIEDPAIKQAVDGLTSGTETDFGIPFFSQKCGFADHFYDEVADSLGVPGYHITAVGTLVADALKFHGGTDCAIIAGGSTSQPLYEGPIVPADIYRMIGQGFNSVNTLGYRVCKFKMTGLALYSALEACLSLVTEPSDEFYPQASGLKFSCDISLPVGSRITSLTIKDQPIDLLAEYSITSNEFLTYIIESMFGILVSEKQTEEEITEFMVVWEYFTGISDVNQKTGNTPGNFELFQNYPNPFNPCTSFEYTIPEACLITIKIYDLLGNEIKSLLNEEQPAGQHKVNFNASGLASGVYLYALTAGSKIQTRKMLLLK